MSRQGFVPEDHAHYCLDCRAWWRHEEEGCVMDVDDTCPAHQGNAEEGDRMVTGEDER